MVNGSGDRVEGENNQVEGSGNVVKGTGNVVCSNLSTEEEAALTDTIENSIQARLNARLGHLFD